MRINCLILSTIIFSLSGQALADQKADKRTLERGRYVVSIGGCNDCHTPRYMESAGNIPQQAWLTGERVGFQGPWGTTYPANLRLLVQSLSEAEWMKRARAEMRPPMPWFALRHMSDSDLRAMYLFIRSLGAAGDPAPAYVPPGQQVSTPYFEFVPKNLPKQAALK